MKKFLSTIIALVSLIAASALFTSCDDSTEEGKTNYGFSYVVSNDFFDLYDINVTMYQDNQATDIQFTQTTTIARKNGTVDAKATPSHTYTLDSDIRFKVEAKVSVKSNWKEIAASKETRYFYVTHATICNNHFDTNSHGFSQTSDKITEEFLVEMGNFLKSEIDFDPSK